MIQLDKVYNRNLKVIEDTVISGILCGDVSVMSEDITLTISGILNGNIYLTNNASVNILGIVNGLIVNDGGTLTISGMINGSVVRKAGQTIITKEAKIIS